MAAEWRRADDLFVSCDDVCGKCSLPTALVQMGRARGAPSRVDLQHGETCSSMSAVELRRTHLTLLRLFERAGTAPVSRLSIADAWRRMPPLMQTLSAQADMLCGGDRSAVLAVLVALDSPFISDLPDFLHVSCRIQQLVLERIVVAVQRSDDTESLLAIRAFNRLHDPDHHCGKVALGRIATLLVQVDIAESVRVQLIRMLRRLRPADVAAAICFKQIDMQLDAVDRMTDGDDDLLSRIEQHPTNEVIREAVRAILTRNDVALNHDVLSRLLERHLHCDVLRARAPIPAHLFDDLQFDRTILNDVHAAMGLKLLVVRAMGHVVGSVASSTIATVLALFSTSSEHARHFMPVLLRFVSQRDIGAVCKGLVEYIRDSDALRKTFLAHLVELVRIATDHCAEDARAPINDIIAAISTRLERRPDHNLFACLAYCLEAIPTNFLSEPVARDVLRRVREGQVGAPSRLIATVLLAGSTAAPCTITSLFYDAIRNIPISDEWTRYQVAICCLRHGETEAASLARALLRSVVPRTTTHALWVAAMSHLASSIAAGTDIVAQLSDLLAAQLSLSALSASAHDTTFQTDFLQARIDLLQAIGVDSTNMDDRQRGALAIAARCWLRLRSSSLSLSRTTRRHLAELADRCRLASTANQVPLALLTRFPPCFFRMLPPDLSALRASISGDNFVSISGHLRPAIIHRIVSAVAVIDDLCVPLDLTAGVVSGEATLHGKTATIPTVTIIATDRTHQQWQIGVSSAIVSELPRMARVTT